MFRSISHLAAAIALHKRPAGVLATAVAGAVLAAGILHVVSSSSSGSAPACAGQVDGCGATTGAAYPWHTKVVSTTFWVGEIFDPGVSDGSQVCSTYDSRWAYHWSGIDAGTVSAAAPDCPGSTYGGCDGLASADGSACKTEPRTAQNNFFPSRASPLENPFYLDLPFDDVNDGAGFAERCRVIPWAAQAGYAGHCADRGFSYMKNRWVELVDTATGNTCYGQIEDAGPARYHDAGYVFGTADERPENKKYNGAGMDVSPALNGCLGFQELDGDGDTVSWRFVDAPPPGPWTVLITTSGVSEP